MIVIAGHVARVTVFDLAGRMAEAIPNRFAAAVFIPRAFDLISGRRSAPDKVFGKGEVPGMLAPQTQVERWRNLSTSGGFCLG
jgi:hypothetical protein